MKNVALNIIVILAIAACSARDLALHFESDALRISQLSENTFVHTSYIKYGDKVYDCNGMIYHNNGEVIVLDTPVDSIAAVELIGWVEEKLKANVKYVVSTHFHEDCLGSLDEFHRAGIESWANQRTLENAIKEHYTLPQHAFSKNHKLNVGDANVILGYHGSGHTKDNIVAYIPGEETLFGGCLIKSMDAGDGNLADADVSEWSNTVGKVKKTYPDLKWVVPGHGLPGDKKLLDYTIEKFKGRK